MAEIPKIAKLTSYDIQLVIDDLEHIRNNNIIHFVVDPHELYDFCFPISPEAASTGKSISIDDIADAQAALNEIFYVSTQKPIIISEYSTELQRIANYLIQQVDAIYSQSEMIDELIHQANLEGFSSENLTEEEILNNIQEHFNVIIAVALGIYNLGISRMKDIIQNRLLLDRLFSKDPVLRKIYNSYIPTALATDINKSLVEEYKQSDDYATDSILLRQRRMAAHKIDSCAVDRIIYLNNQLERAYRDARINKRHLLLYLSSARKTRKIFKMPSVINALPIINDRQYPIWRTREQLYAYVVCKGDSSRKDRRTIQTLKRLRNLQRIVVEVSNLAYIFKRRAERKCDQCLLQGGDDTDCWLYQFCQKVDNLQVMLGFQREKADNLGLVSAAAHYDMIQAMEIPDKWDYKQYFIFIKQVMDERGTVRSFITDRMQYIYDLLAIQSNFVEKIPLAFAGFDQFIFKEQYKDAVTSLSQRYPINPRIEHEQYSEIMDIVIKYFVTPFKDAKSILLVQKAYSKFIDIEKSAINNASFHELVRSYLYFAMPIPKSEDLAYEHCSNMWNKFPEIDKEYRYIIIWILRRLKKYSYAYRYAKEGIDKYPDDPRFYHGLCLAIFSWLSDEEQRDNCRLTIKYAIESCKKALDLYIKENAEPILIGACWNNIAYLYCWERNKRWRNLTQARSALDNLEKTIPTEILYNHYPEYLHTFAYLEYQEYLEEKQSGQDPHGLIAKLKDAKKAISGALKKFSKNEYKILSNKITNALNDLESH